MNSFHVIFKVCFQLGGRRERANGESAGREMFLINHSYSMTRDGERKTMLEYIDDDCEDYLFVRAH